MFLAQLRGQVSDGASQVELQPLPNQDWMKRPDPFGEPWMARFKLYYGIPEDIEISPPN